MLYFLNDYSEGGHPEVMNVLKDTNKEKSRGYGCDEYCDLARDMIRDKINYENVDVHFFAGGTITNLTFIAHALRPYEAVICCKYGHINRHETGAIEATGHKVLEVDGKDYKVTVEDIKARLIEHENFHMVKPKMVYLSNSTELGTLYTKKELEDISKFCHENNLYLYLDGARLATALMAETNDIKLTDYPKYCDAFYIGGTKCGALFGEALVIVNDDLKKDFKFSMKQRGGLMAKGRLLGVQFIELFRGDLYSRIGVHQNKMAMKLKNGLVKLGYELVTDSYTNQIFVYLMPNQVAKLKEKVYFDNDFYTPDEREIVRFVTSWATTNEEVDELLEIMKNL